MKTYQLKFLAWTFSAFLPLNDPSSDEHADKVDYYELLGVATNANADDIKKAYRKRCAVWWGVRLVRRAK
jgi:preprotein translocase subunit Sec63